MPAVFITAATVTQNTLFSTITVAVAMASTHYTYPLRDGQAELACVGWIKCLDGIPVKGEWGEFNVHCVDISFWSINCTGTDKLSHSNQEKTIHHANKLALNKYKQHRKPTSNVTGHHRGLQRKLWAGYRAPSWNHWAMCRQSFFAYWTSLTVMHVIVFIVECGIARILRATCVFKVWASSSPLGYSCAKFHFCGDLCCWASPWIKIMYSINQSLNHSLTQLIWCCGNQSESFGKLKPSGLSSVHLWLDTTVVHNTAQNSCDNPPDNHHSSDIVYTREGKVWQRQ